MPKKLPRRLDLCDILVSIGALNFLTFMAGAFFFGGTAMIGKRAGGQYFLGDHGRLVRVSAAVYWYSYVHGISDLITFPVAFIAGFIKAVDHDDGRPTPDIRGRGTV